MMPRTFAFCMALLAGVSAARASVIINVGDHPLLPNTANQKVPIYISGSENIISIQLQCQVADGGPLANGFITGPTIASLDVLTGTIFAGNNSDQRPDLGGVLLPQLATRGTLAGTGTVSPNGLVATVTLDTTGFSAIGQSWELRFKDTVNGDSMFGDTPITVTNGSIYLATAVPEPATALLLGSAGAASLLRRRMRR